MQNKDCSARVARNRQHLHEFASVVPTLTLLASTVADAALRVAAAGATLRVARSGALGALVRGGHGVPGAGPGRRQPHRRQSARGQRGLRQGRRQGAAPAAAALSAVLCCCIPSTYLELSTSALVWLRVWWRPCHFARPHQRLLPAACACVRSFHSYINIRARTRMPSHHVKEGAWALHARCLTCMPLMQAKRYTPFGNGIRNCVGQQLAMSNVPTGRGLRAACIPRPPHINWRNLSSYCL